MMGIATRELTYEDYMCSPEEMRRYEILDGEKTYMTNPTIRHQRLQKILCRLLDSWQIRSGNQGELLMAPVDVLIRRNPLRTRQPDLLYISQPRLQDRADDDPSPLEPSPELVIEILSPSDTVRVLAGKLADYRSVGVKECWVVNTRSQTLEVLRLTQDGDESVGVFSVGQTAQSGIFQDLSVEVSAIFGQ